MQITTSNDSNKDKASQSLHNLQQANQEDLHTVIQLLAKITNLSPELVQPHLDTMLEQLVSKKERPFYETATAEEWIRALHEWSASHNRNIPLLSDYAVSREGIYDEEM